MARGICNAFLTAAVLLTGAATGQAAVPTATSKPNIVVILADDIGAQELGCYGNTKHRTPNLDKLAETGVKFETCFTAPVCHPTRFMIMTGQYGCHNGVLNFDNMRGGPERNDPRRLIESHVTFGTLMKDAGYATAIAGKWQLGGQQPTLIRQYGFDEYCMWGYAGYYTAEDRKAVEAAGIDFASRYWHPSVVQNGKWVPTKESDYGPDIHSDFVLDFIRRKKDGPFFVYYPICLTHSPWLPTPDTRTTDQPMPKKAAKAADNFKANVEYMDKLVGKLISTLDALHLRENTIVFFTGDNGTGNDGKSLAVEKGARVPMIVNGPGLVKQRGSSMVLTDLSDILPTLVDLGGAKLPTDRPIDGHSYADYLRGQTDTTRPWIFAFQADRRILRTDRWLLEDNSPLHYGHLFDCGDHRDGSGYKDVTQSQDPEVLEARKFFDGLLAKLPAPVLSSEGPPNEVKASREEKKEEKAAKRKGEE